MLAIVGLQAAPLASASAAVSPARAVMLDAYYPDTTQVRAGFFLAGLNVAGPSSQPSDFWFADVGGGAFRQYNWAPFQSCHWDQLQWTGGVLRYDATHDGCGTADGEVDYLPGVAYMPRRWVPGSAWSATGTSVATYTDHGKVACRGINHWSSRAVASSPSLYRFETTQTILWTFGSDPSGCRAGGVTRWYDSFTLAPLRIAGSSATNGALVGEVGGNLDAFRARERWDYDVRFATWDHLPS
ncbi:MAG TPA: hypothetical protein VFA84_03780 [Acidimicrobiales bacterium]|nr:hypothetical protein [Acidimicrobiales bacterium]